MRSLNLNYILLVHVLIPTDTENIMCLGKCFISSIKPVFACVQKRNVGMWSYCRTGMTGILTIAIDEVNRGRCLSKGFTVRKDLTGK